MKINNWMQLIFYSLCIACLTVVAIVHIISPDVWIAVFCFFSGINLNIILPFLPTASTPTATLEMKN